MLPEEKARVKIDKQLSDAGWDIVARDEYVPFNASAVKEALMQGNGYVFLQSEQYFQGMV